jgi:hypothetical protein
VQKQAVHNEKLMRGLLVRRSADITRTQPESLIDLVFVLTGDLKTALQPLLDEKCSPSLYVVTLVHAARASVLIQVLE